MRLRIRRQQRRRPVGLFHGISRKALRQEHRGILLLFQTPRRLGTAQRLLDILQPAADRLQHHDRLFLQLLQILQSTQHRPLLLLAPK